MSWDIDLEKAKKMNIGATSTRGGDTYRKVAEGKWVRVPKGTARSAKEKSAGILDKVKRALKRVSSYDFTKDMTRGGDAFEQAQYAELKKEFPDLPVTYKRFIQISRRSDIQTGMDLWEALSDEVEKKLKKSIDLEKAKAATVGTRSVHGGKKVVKTAQGWVPDTEGREPAKRTGNPVRPTDIPIVLSELMYEANMTTGATTGMVLARVHRMLGIISGLEEKKMFGYPERLKPPDYRAWLAYKGHQHYYMNAVLRHPNQDHAKSDIDLTDNMILAFDTVAVASKRAVRTFRTTRILDTKLKDLKPGSLITDRGFLSTSMSRYQAEAFTKPADGVKSPTLFIIDVPKGTKMMGGSEIEHELILGPGSTVKVDSVSEGFRDGRKIMIVHGSIVNGNT